MQIAEHGTYPYDRRDRWKKVKNITPEEAAAMLKLPKAEPYMLLNKGYIVLDLMELFEKEPLELKMFRTDEIFSTQGSPILKAGMRAIYLHDGTYSIIERV